jgi:hypothetical protein
MRPAVVDKIVRSHLLLMRAATIARKLSPGSQQRTRLALFHVGRCGSTVLSFMLRQNPNVDWGDEIFDAPNLVATPGFRPSRPWIRSMIEIVANGSKRECFGFESRVHDFHAGCIPLTKTDFVSLLEDIGFTHFIVLRRHNLLRVVISARVARETGRLHVGREPRQATRVQLDVADPLGWSVGSLIEFIEGCDRFYEEVDDALSGKNKLEIAYEADIEGDPSVAYNEVCRFVDIEPTPAQPQQARTNPFTIEEMLINYDEVAEVLRGTRFEWMLTDGRR